MGDAGVDDVYQEELGVAVGHGLGWLIAGGGGGGENEVRVFCQRIRRRG